MSESKKAVICAIEHQQDAIAMGTLNGVPQSNFEAMATTDPSGGGASPTHCWTTGFMDDIVIDAFLADARFQVLEPVYRARTAAIVLAEHNPVLYQWVAP